MSKSGIIPDLGTDLLSVLIITDRGHEVVFKKDSEVILDLEGNMMLKASKLNGLYIVKKQIQQAERITEQRNQLELKDMASKNWNSYRKGRLISDM